MPRFKLSQCISCGSNKIFFERLCQQCYLENYPILKNKKAITVTVCNLCELIAIKGHWTEFYLSDIETSELNEKFENLLSQEWDFFYRSNNIQIINITLNFEEKTSKYVITGMVNIIASPDPFVPLMTISEDFNIDIEWGDCSECRLRLGGSYASKIQVRSLRKIEAKQIQLWGTEIEQLSQMFPLSDGKNPLFKIIQLKNGFDALFQTRSPANSVGRLFAKKYGGVVSVTTEFAGFDKSKSKEYPRKPVVLINMPEFDVGEIVILSQDPIQILNFNSKVSFWDYKKKTRRTLPLKVFLDLKPKILEMKIKEFQIVNFEQDRSIAQIMDTKTFETQYVNSIEVNGLSEGEFISGILFDGLMLTDQLKD